MKHTLPLAAIVGAIALSGCSNLNLFGGGKADNLIDTSPGINTSKLDPRGEADYLLAFQSVRAADVTTRMPSGSARYLGGLGGEVTGGLDGFMTGAVDATVHDLGNGRITGSVTEMALHDAAGERLRDFDGALTMQGAVSGSSLTSTATGAIADGSSSSNVTLNLAGDFRSLDGAASAATGTVTGSGTGATAFTMGDGSFYLVEN